MTIKFIDDIDLSGKRALIRVDYNVPYDGDMRITDDSRITATLPTIRHCLERNASIIIVSHLGRPKGKPVPAMSLKPVAERLASLLGKKVTFTETPPGPELKKEVEAMKPGDIVLLENIRFYPGEEKNDPELGKNLAALCDVFINDAFAAAHRGHASNDAITNYAGISVAGFLLKDEIEYFKKAMENPERPLGALIGGAKVSTKLEALKHIVSIADFLVIGGGMAFTFLKASGLEVGKSLLEEELVGDAREVMALAEKKGAEVLLPVDIVVAQEFNNDAPRKVVAAGAIPEDMIGLDIGPESVRLFSEKIKGSRTVIWNGPMGAFEMPHFAEGTFSIARALAESGCLSIVGGGDSVAAVNQSGVADRISYISTGGGAWLELLEGKTLPGIAALDR
jgi:phosphoglycerate kinase